MNTNWIPLTSLDQLSEISANPGFSLIFKHSTRCSVSMMAKRSFEMEMDAIPSQVSLYFLDLIRFREISNAIAEKFQVHHESPQIILVDAGKVIFHTSHGQISALEIANLVPAEK